MDVGDADFFDLIHDFDESVCASLEVTLIIHSLSSAKVSWTFVGKKNELLGGLTVIFVVVRVDESWHELFVPNIG